MKQKPSDIDTLKPASYNPRKEWTPEKAGAFAATIAADLKADLPTLEGADLAAITAEEPSPGNRAANKAQKEKFTREINRRAATFLTTAKAADVQFMDAKGITKAAAAIKSLPKPNCYVHGVTFEEFTVFDIIPSILKLSGQPRIDRLIFTTLGFGYNNLGMLDNLINARKLDPKSLFILASGFFKTMENEGWKLAEQHAKAYGYTLTTCRNHTKIILMHIGQDHYVIESSSNMRSCRAIEQFTMTNNTELFSFHEAWIKEAPTFAAE